MKKRSDTELAERLQKVLWDCRTWGSLERAAGVTDRQAFWKGKTETEAGAVLRSMIAERLRNGAFDAPR